MFGLPLEIVVFVGVIAIMALLIPVFMHFSKPSGKQAARVRKRVMLAAAATSGNLPKSDGKSLRKGTGDSTLPTLTRMLANWQVTETIRYRLARSGKDWTAERFMAYSVLLFAACVIIFHVYFQRSLLVSLMLSIVVSIGFPHIIIGFLIGRRVKRFLQLFPDAIDLIVRGLKAGLPVTESMKMVGREIEDPVGLVFRDVTEKMALGVPLEKTLYETARKYQITELDFFVTSIVLQRETGGNLSEVLGNLSDALRQRLMMRLKIRAMSSEARASMYIICALPFAVMIALLVTSPGYLDPLVDDYRGNICAFIAMGMMASGVFIMGRMAKFEI